MKILRQITSSALCLLSILLSSSAQTAEPDVLYADFEAKTYGDWSVTGHAFGDGPAAGTLAGQMAVSGHKGERLVNSFNGGDDAVGSLTSPVFKIERKYISFLIGGGGFEGKTCMNLLVDDKVVRTATGTNTQPGGSELLETAQWDVTEFAGKSAHLQIVDNATGGWGHVLVDQIVFTETRAPLMQTRASRELVATKRLLLLPVKNGAPMREVKVLADGKSFREFSIEAADDAPDWWAVLDVSAQHDQTLKIAVDKLSGDSKFLSSVELSDAPKDPSNLYHEPLRPQFHFSPARGWNNDPNGLVYFNGEYHMFFQLNPYGTKWGNMHWGHAISKDLIHWQEQSVALYPDTFGTMFSGSTVVDWKNASGLGTVEKPPLVLVYTADRKSVQCIASSIDGRTFTKYDRNPVVDMITGGNRDPKVFWHEPTKQWVMALYVGLPHDRNTVHILNSPNLKDWKVVSQIDGFFECPDLFPLAVDGDAKNIKWILTAANSDYMVGQFDGKTFTAETAKLKGILGRGFYAAQTFGDIPASDGRRIMIGWFQTPSPGMSFNQSMTVPLNIKLLTTPDGPRISYLPVKELESLRSNTAQLPAGKLQSDAEPLKDPGGPLLDVRLEFEPGDATSLELTVHGVLIRYDVRDKQLTVDNIKAPSPLIGGKQRLIVLADRNSMEIFASDGVTYVPLPIITKAGENGVSLAAKGGAATINSCAIHVLKSSWDKQ